MELLRPLRALGEKLTRLTGGKKVIVEQPEDPFLQKGKENISRRMLVRFYTDPKMLGGIGGVISGAGGLLKSGEELEELGRKVGVVEPNYRVDAKNIIDRVGESRVATRERLLSMVTPDRQGIIEGEALVEAKRVLSERLKEQGLDRNHRAAATEMLKRIDGYLKKEIPLTGENPQKST